MDYPKTIGIVADLHCGSIFGLLPKKYWNCDTLEASKWMWYRWVELSEIWPPMDLFILNADLIDGKQHRAQGTTLIAPKISKQVEIAIECLKVFKKKAKKIIRTDGTEYHETFEGPLEALDKEFKIKKPPADQTIVRDIKLGHGAILNIKHKPEGEGTLYRGTALDREIIWATLMEQLVGLPKATHIIRSHLHSAGGPMPGMNKVITLTPGWCLQQPYAVHKKYYRWQPSIGGVLMTEDDSEFMGYRTQIKVFPLQKRKASTYEEL